MNFRIDDDTRAMLDELLADLKDEADASADFKAGLSQVIRRAIRYTHKHRPWRATES